MAGIDIKARVGGVWRDETLGGAGRVRIGVFGSAERLARIRTLLDARPAHPFEVVAVPAAAAGPIRAVLIDPSAALAPEFATSQRERGIALLGLAGEPDPRLGPALGWLDPDDLHPDALVWALRFATERPSTSDDEHHHRIQLAGQVAATVAHELNNPLTWLLANLEHVEQQLHRPGGRSIPAAQASELAEAVAEARVGAERMSTVVGELAKITRPPSNQVVPVHLDRLFESAITIAQTHTRGRARTRIACEALHPVRANEARLFQVVLNLIVNAAQAIAPGSPDQNEIVVGTRWAAHRRIWIFVRDTGAGIPAEHLGRLFQPYFTTKAGTGTGLGLALCKRYIEEMGGVIQVESEPGAGTTFRIELPMAVGGDRPTLVPDYDGRPAKILVVDDERLIGRAFARALSEHQVIVAESAREAKAHLTDDSFDLVFTDVLMPGISGVDLFRWIQEHRPKLARRVVFVSGGALDADTASFLEHTDNARFQKPIGARQLREIVMAALRQL